MPVDAWVFDTGPLRHFAVQGWLGVLKFLAGDRPVLIPDTVERELASAAAHASGAGLALSAPWVHVHRSTDLDYVARVAHYEDLLVGEDGKNQGECSVLAMGSYYGCEVVIDDKVPFDMGRDDGMNVTATVPILCDAIRAKRLTTPMVEDLADDLLSGSYYLPFKKGGFRQHVLENGLLDWEDL